MMRTLFVLVAIAVLCAISIRLSPEGLLEDLLMIAFGIDLMVIVFAVIMAALQRLSPPELPD
ncbi:MAG TPA: hypothetical protein PK098_12730 [Phycisphaerales bacterium]|nr:hypothetical protein [Phycisphaerales bacterium]